MKKFENIRPAIVKGTQQVDSSGLRDRVVVILSLVGLLANQNKAVGAQKSFILFYS